jgi:hypothetical protein
MDARIEAETISMGVEAPVAIVHASEKADAPVLMLVSLFDAASVLASFTNQGNSVTAVAPDYFIERKVSGLVAIAA